MPICRAVRQISWTLHGTSSDGPLLQETQNLHLQKLLKLSFRTIVCDVPIIKVLRQPGL